MGKASKVGSKISSWVKLGETKDSEFLTCNVDGSLRVDVKDAVVVSARLPIGGYIAVVVSDMPKNQVYKVSEVIIDAVEKEVAND